MSRPLRAWRAERLLSTRRLAELAGASNKTIVQIESGRHIPSFGTISKICRVLDVAPRDVSEFARAMDTRGGSAEARLPVAGEPADKKRVVCISESVDVLALAQRLIETGRFEVTTRIGSLESFEYIKDSQPDVVIVELEAGQSFGWELLARLRSDPDTNGIPTVVRAREAWLVAPSHLRRGRLADSMFDSPTERDLQRLIATVETASTPQSTTA